MEKRKSYLHGNYRVHDMGGNIAAIQWDDASRRHHSESKFLFDAMFWSINIETARYTDSQLLRFGRLLIFRDGDLQAFQQNQS